MRYRDLGIDAIRVDVRQVIVDWALGDHCNLSCHYCWAESHAALHRPPVLDDVILSNVDHLVGQIRRAWSDDEKRVCFCLGGGEPTLYAQLPQLLSHLRRYGTTMVLSNGSRTLRWWDENCGHIDMTIITYHVGQSDYGHTVSMVRLISQRTLVALHVMLPPLLFDDAIRDYRRLAEDLSDTRVMLLGKVVVGDGSVAMYDDQQLAAIDGLPDLDNVAGHGKGMSNRVSMVLEDGTVVPWDDLTLIKDLHGSFRGYGCMAPREYISIAHDGSIGVLNCGQAFTGRTNIFSREFSDAFSIPSGQISCEGDHCRCLGLYETNKLSPRLL